MLRLDLDGFEIERFSSVADMASRVLGRHSILISINALTLLGDNRDVAALTRNHTGYVDGIGAWILARRKGLNPGARVAGADLWLELLRQNPSARIYCVGATQPVIEAVVSKLREEFPSMEVCGYRNGFLTEADESKLIEDIRRTRPEFVFIATGQPRQEVLADRLFRAHRALYAGLGGSFDVYAGQLKRAPAWMQQLGFEWLYRLCQEPSRWRRMLPLMKLLPLVLFASSARTKASGSRTG